MIRHSLIATAILLCGCISTPVLDDQNSRSNIYSPSEEQIAAIHEAERRPGFGGAWFDKGVLNLGFNASGLTGAKHLASTKIRLVAVQFDLTQLEAAKQRIVEIIEAQKHADMYAVTIDKPRNQILVESVELIGSPGGKCLNKSLVPSNDPINGVPIANSVACPN